MYILSIDQSTSGTKAIIFDEKGTLIHRVTEYHKQYYPKPGWVEHDAEEILQRTLDAIRKVLEESGISGEEIHAVAITNQRETTVLWDRSGKPVYRAIVWQCQRGKSICDDIKKRGMEGFIKEKTGLLVDPYFSASKIKWILDSVEGVRKKAEKGDILFGTIDTWLVWNLTKGSVHATDYSNASRTMLLNMRNLKWDEEILDIFSIPPSILPELKPSNYIFGYTDLNGILKKEVPIAAVMGDSSAALFGHGCFRKGDIKATYGTGTSIMMNTGNELVISNDKIVTSVGWDIDEETTYVLEGNIHCTGDIIKWLIENLQIIKDPKEAEILANSINDNEGVYFVPAFVGLGAPYWDNEARALITGMSRGSGKAHVVRAALESIAYQVKDLFDAIVKEIDIEPDGIRVDGGATENRFLMQFQADILGIPVFVSEIEEISARGVALLASWKMGFLKGLNDIENLIRFRKIYKPSMPENLKNEYYSGWKRAVQRALMRF